METLELYLIVGTPLSAAIGLCGFALYCLISEKLHPERLPLYYNHPDKHMPLYNMGPCDGYSAGTFSW